MRCITPGPYADVNGARVNASGFSIEICIAKKKEKIKLVDNVFTRDGAEPVHSSIAGAATDLIGRVLEELIADL